MIIRSVGHACLEIDASGLRIVTDPWWAGPAYTGQWFPWPAPQPAGLDQRPIDYLYLSHGHEDHLHPATLRTLRRVGTVLVPQLLSGGMAAYLRSELGFERVIEMPHGHTIDLRNGVKATCYINVTDSILVLDDGNRVLVNVNDALHSSPKPAVDYFCRLLRRRHPDIDTLFLGFSGASWFPNCLRLPGKDDRKVAREREELFTDRFVGIVQALQPRVACAFAASFILVEPHNRWINEVKLEVPAPDITFQRKFPGSPIDVHLLLPNDVIADCEILRGTTPRPSLQRLKEVLRAPPPVEEHRRVTKEELRDWADRIERRVNENLAQVAHAGPFTAELRLRECPDAPMTIQVGVTKAHVLLGPSVLPSLVLELRAAILEQALEQEYGIESIVIGYGAVATLRDAAALPHVQALLALLAPRQGVWQRAWNEIRRQPLRSIAAMRRQWAPLALALGSRLGLTADLYQLDGLGASRRARTAA